MSRRPAKKQRLVEPREQVIQFKYIWAVNTVQANFFRDTQNSTGVVFAADTAVFTLRGRSLGEPTDVHAANAFGDMPNLGEDEGDYIVYAISAATGPVWAALDNGETFMGTFRRTAAHMKPNSDPADYISVKSKVRVKGYLELTLRKDNVNVLSIV